jgi:hypothetical protein
LLKPVMTVKAAACLVKAAEPSPVTRLVRRLLPAGALLVGLLLGIGAVAVCTGCCCNALARCTRLLL